MVSADHELSQRRQCALLRLTRSGLYYRPVDESAENLRFMEIIDKQFLETPWYGSRQMARYMQRQGHKCGRLRVRRVRRENSPPDCFLILLTVQDGADADLSDAQHQQEASPAQGLAISSERSGDHLAQPGLVCRYQLHPDAAGLSVSRRHHGLVQPQGPGLAVVEQHGGGLLC